MLQIQRSLPDGFIQTPAEGMADLLGGPTLIELPGRREDPLFVSVLLHGNEITGLHAVQRLLQKYHDSQLPRSLSLFVGNVAAAREGLRRLPGQPDYNRVWPGSECADSPERDMMQFLWHHLKTQSVFASIDIHNNTGLNPHYACVNFLDAPFLHLATLFSRTVVYFTRPTGVQSAAMGQLCPAVTLECGQVGQTYSDQHAFEFLDAALHLSTLPEHAVATHDIDLFHTVAIVKVPEEVDFGYGNEQAPVVFEGDLDHMNFRELAAGTRLARLQDDVRLAVCGNDGSDVGEHFFNYRNGELVTARPLMPSMFTLNKQIVRQDCLGYLMERFPLVS